MIQITKVSILAEVDIRHKGKDDKLLISRVATLDLATADIHTIFHVVTKNDLDVREFDNIDEAYDAFNKLFAACAPLKWMN